LLALTVTVCEAAGIGATTTIVIATTSKNLRPELSRDVVYASIIFGTRYIGFRIYVKRVRAGLSLEADAGLDDEVHAGSGYQGA
jgi:hypothetical protein